MPIRRYPERSTWVAFLDISGFKSMMKDLGSARIALNKFYKIVFNANHEYHRNFDTGIRRNVLISSLIVSDCAILFIDSRDAVNDNEDINLDKARDLNIMLWSISTINRFLIAPVDGMQIMTTCAIDYGPFTYEDRVEDEYTEKNFFYGSAYLNAYLASGDLTPGWCKVLHKDPQLLQGQAHVYNQLAYLRENDGGYDFYWQTIDPTAIDSFKRNYDALTKRRKDRYYYKRIADLLRDISNNPR